MNGVERITAGVEWERKVAAALVVRGWDVEPFGQGLLSARAREWVADVSPVLRWLPDMLARRAGHVVAVDAKGGTRYVDTGNHDVETSSAWAAKSFEEWTGIDEWFVFRDRRCVRPSPLLALDNGTFRGNGSGTPFVVIRCTDCPLVDDVFGHRTDVTANIVARESS